MTDTTQAPSAADLERRMQLLRMGRIAGPQPAEVISYDSARQSVRVRLLIEGRRLLADGTSETYQRDEIANVPVVFFSAAGIGITFPIEPGSTVYLIVGERDTDSWRANGERLNTPEDWRRFDLNDAVALPGGRSLNTAAGDRGPLGASLVKANTIVVGTSNPAVEVFLGDASVTALAVALAGKVADELNDRAVIYNAHTHVVSGGSTLGPSTPYNAVIPGTVGSERVKTDK